MKRALGAVIIGCVALSAGCSNQQPAQGTGSVPKMTANPAPTTGPSLAVNTPAPASPAAVASASSDDRIIARINGEPVTMAELMKPLLESHGLQILTGIVQLDLLKQEARKDRAPVTADDVRKERELTLGKMFKDADAKEQDQLDAADAKGDKETAEKLRKQISDDREALLIQYLENQHFSRSEFDLKMEINTYLRKKAERLLQGKITDEMVEKEFGVEYGETADVRYIELANMQQVADARQRLKNGQDFGDVAEQISHDARTAPLKGLMPGISRQTPGLPETFKEMAFSLQPGQVSDTLNLNGFFFILKLEQKHAPKAVKFENVKESLRKSMFDRLVTSVMGRLSDGLGRDIVQKLQIDDPILKKQYDGFMARQQQQAMDRQKLEKQLDKERAARNAAAETQPAGAAPANEAAPAAAPAAAAAAPATQP
ncbi:MAG TPA: peptidylprolyl isomerase [Tepidisphaeraceae bacterium]